MSAPKAGTTAKARPSGRSGKLKSLRSPLAAPPSESTEKRSARNGSQGRVRPARSKQLGRSTSGGGRRWWPVLRWTVAVLLVVVPAVLAGVLSSGRPPTYAAVSDIYYRTTELSSAAGMDRELATQEVLMTGREAIEAAADVVDEDPDAIAEAVTTEIVEGSTVLRLRVEDRSGAVARTISRQLVDRYIGVVQQRESAGRAEQRAAIDASIADLNGRLLGIADRVRAIAASGVILPPALQAEQRGLEDQAQVLREQLSALQQQALQWDIDNAGIGGQRVELVVPPTLLDDPVGPQPLRAAAGGALVGLLLAVLLLAFGRRRPDGTGTAVGGP